MKFIITKVIEIEAESREEAIANQHLGKIRTFSVYKGLVNHGPGTELKALIDKFGFKPAKQCKCKRRMFMMNEMGSKWCRQNIDKILGWLEEEANRANIIFFKPGARIMVMRAISNAEKKERK